MVMLGRDAAEGYVWLSTPSIRDGRGPERVVTDDPPADWTPPAPVGFAPPASTEADIRPKDSPVDVTPEPLTWEGDQS